MCTQDWVTVQKQIRKDELYAVLSLCSEFKNELALADHRARAAIDGVVLRIKASLEAIDAQSK
jgi:hypothetical protein